MQTTCSVVSVIGNSWVKLSFTHLPDITLVAPVTIVVLVTVLTLVAVLVTVFATVTVVALVTVVAAVTVVTLVVYCGRQLQALNLCQRREALEPRLATADSEDTTLDAGKAENNDAAGKGDLKDLRSTT